ncbi:MAG: YhjD/YihY/BrkB family envelope integrity protein [Rectinemataceae bacterium]|jgi:membrane protein
MKRTRRAATALAQRLVFAFERYGEHELANHAAAGAYAFLLSAIPMILLALGLASALLRARPSALAEAERTVASFLGTMAATDDVKAFFGRPLGGLAAGIGALSLLYSARLLIVTIQRGIRVIWATSGKSGVIHENLLGFLLELVVLVAVVAIIAASEATRFLAGAFGPGALFGEAIHGAAHAAPPAVLLAFVYMNYRIAPSERPPRRVAFASALLCVLATFAFSSVFGLFMSEARYNLLYGIFGNLIVLLANVYIFFCLFFIFAEVVYVEEHFDALLFVRYQRCLRSPSAPRIERSLFAEPERLIRLYGRSYARDEKVFSAGEGGREAYFVQRGGIGIYIPTADGELRLATVEKGEIFGEMALIQGEARSATARADVESLVLVIPAEVFELYIKSDDVSRGLAELLSDRLRKANERFGSSR